MRWRNPKPATAAQAAGDKAVLLGLGLAISASIDLQAELLASTGKTLTTVGAALSAGMPLDVDELARSVSVCTNALAKAAAGMAQNRALLISELAKVRG